jgi:hypothetical protein
MSDNEGQVNSDDALEEHRGNVKSMVEELKELNGRIEYLYAKGIDLDPVVVLGARLTALTEYLLGMPENSPARVTYERHYIRRITEIVTADLMRVQEEKMARMVRRTRDKRKRQGGIVVPPQGLIVPGG